MMENQRSPQDGPTSPTVLSSVFSSDNRGKFSKPLHSAMTLVTRFDVREIFWTASSRGTIRGMHFQLPPSAIGKLVWVSHGEIMDVVVDLRKDGTFGKVESFRLDSNAGDALWIPANFAHGFQALSDDAIVNYAVDGDFDPNADAGIRWDSIDYGWPLPPQEVSLRDQGLPHLSDFRTPF